MLSQQVNWVRVLCAEQGVRFVENLDRLELHRLDVDDPLVVGSGTYEASSTEL